MKKQFLTHIAMLTFLLTACGNSTEEKMTPQKLNSYTSQMPEYEDQAATSHQDNIAQNKIETKLLATYSTSLQSSSDERVNNIKIVCERLNNYILAPHATFSYNTVTGPFGPSDGFEEAPILLSDGTHSEGYGGGVCQLSSTLYNVVKNIENIEIKERHHHSAPVSYVPEGEDATVSLQSHLDFQFQNNNDFAIQFEALCDDQNVTVWAYQKQ